MYYIINLVIPVPVKADAIEDAENIAKWALKKELSHSCDLTPSNVESVIILSQKDTKEISFYTGELLTMVVYKKKED